VLLFAGTAYADYGKKNNCDGYKGKLLNACHKVTHPERDTEAGIGMDILIHEAEHVDVVAEYKVDFNNDNDQSIYGVVRTKTSLVDLAKKLVKKIKGDSGE
jgi:hypothetical protein